jgi:hypothetical protein
MMLSVASAIMYIDWSMPHTLAGILPVNHNEAAGVLFFNIIAQNCLPTS